MLAILLLAATTGAAVPSQADTGRQGAVIRQAEARVRIVAGARITSSEVPDVALVKSKSVTGADGAERPARLIEFP